MSSTLKPSITSSLAEPLLSGPPRSEWEKLIATLSPISTEEVNRRMQGQQRLKERLSSVPFYAERAEKWGPGYWEDLHASQIKN